MVCPKCGKKTLFKTAFCPACGTNIEEYKEEPKEEPKSPLCPYCGTPIGFDDVRCPGCRMELQKSVSSSITQFFERINKIDDETKKIEMIKTFPIPNTREDIIEFMLLAATNFDAKYYVDHKDIENVSPAGMFSNLK